MESWYPGLMQSWALRSKMQGKWRENDALHAYMAHIHILVFMTYGDISLTYIDFIWPNHDPNHLPAYT